MNLSRFLTSSSPSSQKRLLLRFIASSPFSTAASPANRSYKRNPKTQSSKTEEAASSLEDNDLKLPRPREIPFQPKVANTVHLIGTIGVPVQLQTSPEGVFSAASVLFHEKTVDFPQFWIPVIFQGDLAKIAACHLNERDLVYITGQLSGDAPPVKFENVHANVQVLVRTLSFVQQGCLKKEGEFPHPRKEVASDFSGTSRLVVLKNLWSDLLDNPQNWQDYRINKLNPKFPDFKHKDTRESLWLNTAPAEIIPKLDSLQFAKGNSTTKPMKNSSENEKENLWKDLVENPKNWWDNRSDKLKPSQPDFKHKVSGEALWIDSSTTPSWVLTDMPLPSPKSKNDTR
ncbi:hypothetical protein J5N97_026756 [Dioscorea zingiberensis]|uniref:Uncharacterized protein n=1 Tax=Dioscorea zingiberensis TaxID=325984 RepID=A0A9D5C3J8_9LILI|nr:hypothetical protein J5N97_026756 [Dioscorea zingiberensis]